MTDMKFPGSYTLVKAVISPESGGDAKPFEITHLIPEFNIEESMHNDCIRGSALVMDFVGLLDSYPLRAEERLELVIRDPMGFEQPYDLFIYKIDNVHTTSENHGMSYTIHFVSYQRFLASRRRIIRAFKYLKVSEIASIIFEEYYKHTMPGVVNAQEGIKEMMVSDTEGVFECTIPKMSPMQALEFLTRRAYGGDKHPSCSYRFFENTQAFFFTTDEWLFKEAIQSERVFKLTSLPNMQMTNVSFEHQMANLEEVRFDKRSNTMEDMNNGAYVSSVFEIDILKGVANIRPIYYDYMTNRDKYFLEGHVPEDRHTESFVRNNFTPANAKTLLFVKDYADEMGGSLPANKHIPEIVQNRMAYRAQLAATAITAKGPGRMDITCGDIVKFDKISNHEDQIVSGDRLSGHYLVMSVNRVFKRDSFSNHYTMAKCGWEKQ